MCITCACNEPESDHGNPKQITLTEFREAANASETDMAGLLKNIEQGLPEVRGRPGRGRPARTAPGTVAGAQASDDLKERLSVRP